MGRIEFSDDEGTGEGELEEWREIAKRIWVSNEGRVWWSAPPWAHVQRPGIVKQALTKNGYRMVTIPRVNNGKPIGVHRLVAHAFHGECPEGMCVDHIDADPSNNCAENLQYVTPAENTRLYWERRKAIDSSSWAHARQMTQSLGLLRLSGESLRRRQALIAEAQEQIDEGKGDS